MPEGDTVFRAARSMHRALAGQVLVRTDFRVPRLATTTLAGQTVTEVVSRGKHILVRTDAGWTLHTHFLMEGEYKLFKAGEPWKGGPAFEIRIVLETAKWTAVGYRMPVIDLIKTAHEPEVVGHLGPDLLGPDWDIDEALRRILEHPELEIGEALLEQRFLSGIGNVFKCEVLFLRGLNPFSTVAQVPDMRATVHLAYRLMQANRDTAVRTTTGDSRRGQNLWVYGRDGQPCRRCRTRIERRTQGNDPLLRRISWWCPHCQPSIESSAAPTGLDLPVRTL